MLVPKQNNRKSHFWRKKDEQNNINIIYYLMFTLEPYLVTGSGGPGKFERTSCSLQVIYCRLIDALLLHCRLIVAGVEVPNPCV